MTDSKNYMFLFSYAPNPNFQPTDEILAKMHSDWSSFIGGLAIQEKLVSTHKLGFAGAVISTDMSVSKEIRQVQGVSVSGNMIVRCDTLDAAIDMAKACPIYNMGGTVEVREIEPMN